MATVNIRCSHCKLLVVTTESSILELTFYPPVSYTHLDVYKRQVQRQPGANIISTADSIRQMLPQLTESLPKSVKVTVLSDRTTNIRASVDDTQFRCV